MTRMHAPSCPIPTATGDRVQLGHGSGGKMTGHLLAEYFLPHLSNATLAKLSDAAVLSLESTRIAFSTDSFVVQPIEFPGGNIGSLAVHGTVNDLAMMGATPLYLSAGFVLEEGLPLVTLERIVRAMAESAVEAGVEIVCGDTKAVERGKADQIFINTTGIGIVDTAFEPAPERVRPGDAVIVSGPIGRHGIAVMASREGIDLDVDVTSDSANLSPLVEALRAEVGSNVHAMRDPTRGGVASALNETAATAKVGIELNEEALPIPEPVAAACEVLGFDPLYVANEGLMLLMVDGEAAEAAVEALRSNPLGGQASTIGMVVEAHPGMVTLRTAIGGNRIVDTLPGDQLPRIC